MVAILIVINVMLCVINYFVLTKKQSPFGMF